jgi:hypothetical protein
MYMKHHKFGEGFRKLVAWQEAHGLTMEIYKVTAAFPRDEQYGLTSQLRRAASSIGAQIAEGSRMGTPSCSDREKVCTTWDAHPKVPA